MDYHDTLGSDTEYVVFNSMSFQAYGNRRERSSSPFKDYGDRDLGSSYSAHAWSSRVTWFLDIKLGQPRELHKLHEVVEHPSEGKMRNGLCFHSCFVVPWFYSHLL